MKKWFYLLFFLILLSLNVFGQQSTLNGVILCNVQNACGVNDGICPQDFFPKDVNCYIRDEDCCNLNLNSGKEIIGWSSSADNYVPLTKAYEGQSIYMYVETTPKCRGKDANFEIFLLDENIFGVDRILETEEKIIAGPFPVPESGKLTIPWIAYTDPGAVKKGISRFKFRVKINPTADSPPIEVSLGNGQVIENINSCNDKIDNDADGCADEGADCTDGKEDQPNSQQCPVCNIDPVNGVVSDVCRTKCLNWKCAPGDCLEGRKGTNCQPVPYECPLTQPPKFVKCYEKLIPFPFYDNFNLVLSIFSLIGYYGLKPFLRKRFTKKEK